MLDLMYITNEEKVAKIAENSGVDRIFIDLEILGKDKRQGHLDTVISRHKLQDVCKIKSVLKKADLLVRVNPINENSEDEINKVIEYGADIVMIPFFKTIDEVRTFIKFVNNRVRTCLLLETPEAVKILDEVLDVEGIDEIHIGLNDLHLGYKMKFMFELLSNGTVEKICNKIKRKKIKYGFGGIAKVGEGTLSAEHILGEHYRLGSNMVILSRSFCNTKNERDIEKLESIFKKGVEDIREKEKEIQKFTLEQFEDNRKKVREEVENIIKRMENK